MKAYTQKLYLQIPNKSTNNRTKAIHKKSAKNKLLPNWQQKLTNFSYLDYGLKVDLLIVIS